MKYAVTCQSDSSTSFRQAKSIAPGQRKFSVRLGARFGYIRAHDHSHYFPTTIKQYLPYFPTTAPIIENLQPIASACARDREVRHRLNEDHLIRHDRGCVPNHQIPTSQLKSPLVAGRSSSDQPPTPNRDR
jgi:hypothetical protein